MALTILDERFWNNVDKRVDCWVWTASVDRGGYGHFKIDGRGRLVHRLAYEALVGPIPDGLTLDHTCRVRNCVNPEHLEPVTLRENQSRQIARCAKITHCPRGHEYTPGNTQRGTQQQASHRRCATCHRDNERARRALRRAEPSR